MFQRLYDVIIDERALLFMHAMMRAYASERYFFFAILLCARRALMLFLRCADAPSFSFTSYRRSLPISPSHYFCLMILSIRCAIRHDDVLFFTRRVDVIAL